MINSDQRTNTGIESCPDSFGQANPIKEKEDEKHKEDF